MVQTESLRRKQRVEHAIELALERDWDLAAEENRALLDEDPDDVEAANRLGKALTELNNVAAATEAYEHALGIDPGNTIARKNLARIAELARGSRAKQPKKRAAQTKKKRAKAKQPPSDLRIHALVEESGKSAEFPLLQVNAQALKRVSAGDTATLEAADQGVEVKSASGATLGTIQPRAGLRLKRMMEGGNEYAVVIRRAEGDEAIVHIRQTRTDPELAGQASFITPPSAPKRRRPRAYTKPSVVQHEGDDSEPDVDEETQDEQDGGRPRRGRAADGQADEMEERGFTETVADDEDDEDGVAELGKASDQFDTGDHPESDEDEEADGD